MKNLKKYDGIILAVAHNQFKKLNFEQLLKDSKSVIFDLKSVLKKSNADVRL